MKNISLSQNQKATIFFIIVVIAIVLVRLVTPLMHR